MVNFEPVAAILCDEVRREDNGKQFVIGVYGSEVFVSAFPLAIQFCLLIRLSFSGAGKHSIKLKIETGGEGKQELGAEMETIKASKEWLAVPLQPMIFDSASTILVFCESPNRKWKKLLSVPILLGPKTTA